MDYPIKDWRRRVPSLTPEEYASLARAAIASLPPAGECDATTKWGCAILRMKTLSKMPCASVPEDVGVIRALWFSLALASFPGDASRTRARLIEASDACIRITREAAPPQREELRRQCGLVAEAASRLLYAGAKTAFKEE